MSSFSSVNRLKQHSASDLSRLRSLMQRIIAKDPSICPTDLDVDKLLVMMKLWQDENELF